MGTCVNGIRADGRLTVDTADVLSVLGGQNVLPFYTFDAPIENKPKIGVEITDAGMELCTTPGMQAFYAGCATVADWSPITPLWRRCCPG